MKFTPQRLIFILLFASLTSGCGFEPVYGTKSSINESLTSIHFSDPKSEAEFTFLGFAEQEFVNSKGSDYELKYNVSFADMYELSGVRFVRGQVSYSLAQKGKDEVLFTGVVRRVIDLRVYSGDFSWVKNVNNRSRLERDLARDLAQGLHLDVISRFSACGEACQALNKTD